MIRDGDSTAFNMIGFIHVLERDDRNIVTIEFHDRASRTGTHFDDFDKCTLGALGKSDLITSGCYSLKYNELNQVTSDRFSHHLQPRLLRVSSCTNLTSHGRHLILGSTSCPMVNSPLPSPSPLLPPPLSCLPPLPMIKILLVLS